MNINETAKETKKRRFFRGGHRHDNLVASFEYARVNKSIIYVTMHERKAPINNLSRRKTQQIETFTHMRITSDFLVVIDPDGTFVPAKTLLKFL